MTKVYLTQRPTFRNQATGQFQDKFDLTPALKYGEIVEILRPGNISADHQYVMETILQKLKNFKSEDFMLALGDPVAMCAAACIALDYTNGFLQILKWDKHRLEYVPYVINLRYGTRGAGVFANE